MNCEGCGKQLNPIEATRWTVCWECVNARARTVGNNGRCKCGRRRVEGAVLSNGSRHGGRSWIPCKRCLGTVRQLS